MEIKSFFQELKKDKTKRIKFITFLTMIYNFIWSVAKIIFGVFSTMFFFCLSGVMTLLIGFIKKIFYNNIEHDSFKIKYKKSQIINILLIIIGILFIVYMLKLIFFPESSSYSLIASITIAAFSFGELGVSIYNIVQARKSKDILLTNLRNCNFASALFAIVLTQTAILSAQGVDASLYNVITGSIAGFVVVVIAVINLILLKINKQKIEQQTENKIEI